MLLLFKFLDIIDLFPVNTSWFCWVRDLRIIGVIFGLAGNKYQKKYQKLKRGRILTYRFLGLALRYGCLAYIRRLVPHRLVNIH